LVLPLYTRIEFHVAHPQHKQAVFVADAVANNWCEVPSRYVGQVQHSGIECAISPGAASRLWAPSYFVNLLRGRSVGALALADALAHAPPNARTEALAILEASFRLGARRADSVAAALAVLAGT
jgi:hypothetical protein